MNCSNGVWYGQAINFIVSLLFRVMAFRGSVSKVVDVALRSSVLVTRFAVIVIVLMWLGVYAYFCFGCWFDPMCVHW